MGRTLCAQPVKDRVDAELIAFFDATANSMEPDAAELLVPLRAMLTRGKHASTAFCHNTYRALGGDDTAAVWPKVCAALELAHLAMLTHDDVIDRSATRRGQDAVHRAYASQHLAAGWTGDASRYGMDMALCVGDLLVIQSETLMDSASPDTAQAKALMRVMRQMYRDEVYGETLELRAQQDRVYQPDRCAKVARWKTGRWIASVSACGAVSAHADPETVAVMDQFGELMGFAYQMRDDLLGVFGDSAVTGKPTMDDFRDGKPTVLIALAISQADAAGIETIEELYGKPTLSEDDGDVLRAVIEESGAVKRVEEMINAHIGKAEELLSAHRAESSDLLALAHAALNRSS
ncbi:geranylgeranyl diphosphate synthase type I [Herbihabitans rhizosphaerae]|uniref:Geranylgeranyl diphosphate synthase type I n=1 Tax=Herbihabitans rhizosphaerae TaxID=1872711 RepID=A0A4Q7KGH2_9PSEU|nr:polyprenyl synthetase family protein [Herbihabitans rhizosphaerae]RZS33948.1 geranylgeranyl diphosphate synthase type I [Herbihabitans rhizosphaerae]